MSETNFLSHGTYETVAPPSALINAYLAGFQYCASGSGAVAAPTSPRPPPRASGATVKNDTPVVIGVNVCIVSSVMSSSCAHIMLGMLISRAIAIKILFFILNIIIVFI